MRHFKRNQVEDAIPRVMLEIGYEPSSDLGTRLKRLLNLDRSLERKSADSDPVTTYAFYSAEAPGKGTEVLFSEYESFALLMGLRLLNSQWPQSFVVETMRRVRHDLEREHRRILRLDKHELFDRMRVQKTTEKSFFQGTNSSPAFLLIISDASLRGQNSNAPYSKIFQDPLEAYKFQLKEAGRSCTWYELVTAAWSLHRSLAATKPTPRGR